MNSSVAGREGTIPIPSIDTVDTCELGVSIDTSTKYRWLSILSLFCLWLACMCENLKKMSIKAKKKLKNAIFFLEVCLIELDKDKNHQLCSRQNFPQ